MNGLGKDFQLFARDRYGVSSTTLSKVASTYISPSIVEEREMNFQVMDVFSKLIMNRIIFLGTEVTSEVANVINSQLLYLSSVSDDDITMYINSPGGSVVDGLAIYDTMHYIKPDVSTICIGLCASMGAVLLSSGERGKRHSLPNGSIMIHQPLIGGHGITGQASDILIEADEMKKCREKLYNILSENCQKEYGQIESDSDRNFWMTAQEAASYGLIDNVLTKQK